MNETISKPRRCPICGRPATIVYRPFCSARCADADLARWLGGEYVIPGGTQPDEDEDGIPGGNPPLGED